MSTRQNHVDQVRKMMKEIDSLLLEGKFTKESERFMLTEARTNLKSAENHLDGFLQVDKFNAN